MATRETTYKGKLGEWERLATTVAANNDDLAHLQPLRDQLAFLLTSAQETASRQASHAAAKQDASQKLQDLMVEGDRLVSLLRLAVKQHYGIGAGKLAEFGLQPFRSRSRKRGPAPSPPPVVEDAPPASDEPAS
jgi:hypothetical protein